jgi:hypothetical protein
MEEMKNAYKILIQICEGKRQIRDQGVDCRIILNWIIRNKMQILRLDLIASV